MTSLLSLRDVGKLRARMKEKRKGGQRRGPAAQGGVKPTHHVVQAFSSPSTMRQCDTHTLSLFTVVGPFLLLLLITEQHDTYLQPSCQQFHHAQQVARQRETHTLPHSSFCILLNNGIA
jgi:hypothetical protein